MKSLTFGGSLIAALFLALSSVPATVTFTFTHVGHPGNPEDPANAPFIPGIGSVAGEFDMAITEVTIGQYTEFLNAVANVSDPHELYHPNMFSNVSVGTILQFFSDGEYHYTTLDDPNVPVTYVTYYDCLRFINWMHNGQPIGPSGPATTEDGAYAFSGTETVGLRKANAKYFLPTENEWYKTAFYQPASEGGDVDHYWNYAFRTNDAPFSDNPNSLNTPDDTRAANYRNNDNIPNGYNDGYAVSGTTSSPPDLALTPVGAYTLAISPYGAFDMGGNVAEWVDTDASDQFATFWAIRGASFMSSGPIHQSAERRARDMPGDESHVRGFRIARKTDTDNDGLSDEEEGILGTDPMDSDSDDDGLSDGAEVNTYGTNPNAADSDGDGFNDNAEIESGHSPTDPNESPDAVVDILEAVEFLFYSDAGADYQVQWSNDLALWLTFPEVIPGTGEAITRLYSTRDGPKKYFRAVKTSP